MICINKIICNNKINIYIFLILEKKNEFWNNLRVLVLNNLCIMVEKEVYN